MLPALTIFIGSFVAFAMEPLIGRTILPSFGGMASVWVTCLAAFQVLLLVGYFYAHVMAGDGCAKRAVPVRAHLALLVLGTAWLGVVGWKYAALAGLAAQCPVPAIGALAAVILLGGIPFVLLSANSSLVQVLAGGNYRLYAVSNLGSFAGLLAYPFLFEPLLAISTQWYILAGLSLLYSVCLLCVFLRRDSAPCGMEPERDCGAQQRSADAAALCGIASPVLWLLIPGATCFLLNAVTCHLTTNVAPIPLMWVILLGVFLLSYVVGFAKWGERLMPLWLLLTLVAGGFSVYAMTAGREVQVRFLWNFVAVTAFLAFGCTALHAWLCRLRPDARMLTRYYLYLSLGGGVGGILSSIACPLLFKGAVEYPVAVALVILLALYALYVWFAPVNARNVIFDPLYVKVTAIAVAVLFSVALFWQNAKLQEGVLESGRSFYGAWSVKRDVMHTNHGKEHAVYVFMHGGIMHGMQPCNEFFRNEPTSYFGESGGGAAFKTHPKYAAGKPVRVAVVGLGIGTMAWYGRPGDEMRLYEICPQVAKLAQKGEYFNFVRNCKAKTEVVVADARKVLEAERAANAPKYDILIIDAYSGDSISMHLITKEAFRLYADRLAEGGTLAINNTNWHISLLPVMKAAAKELGMNLYSFYSEAGLFTFWTQWALFSRQSLNLPAGAKALDVSAVEDVELPTDDKGSLLPYLSFTL